MQIKVKHQFLIDILPASTTVCKPTAPNSPIIGPGGKFVGPAGIIISRGDACPGLAKVFVLFIFINLYNLKGSSLLKIKAGMEFSKLGFNPFKSLSLSCSIAKLIRLFLVTLR